MATTLNIDDVTLEENEDRLKIVIPLKQHWPFLLIYSVLLLVWIGMFFYSIIFTWRMAFSGERFALAFTFLLFLFLFVLYRLGKMIWRQWQYYVANREILFLYEDHMIVRRPVSLFGITTGYAREYMRPFYYDENQRGPAFEYGSLYVLIGLTLARPEAEKLIQFLNGRYFPDYEEDDD